MSLDLQRGAERNDSFFHHQSYWWRHAPPEEKIYAAGERNFARRAKSARRKSPWTIRLKNQISSSSYKSPSLEYRASPKLSCARMIYVPLRKGQSGSSDLYPLYWSTARIIVVRGLLTKARNIARTVRSNFVCWTL